MEVMDMMPAAKDSEVKPVPEKVDKHPEFPEGPEEASGELFIDDSFPQDDKTKVYPELEPPGALQSLNASKDSNFDDVLGGRGMLGDGSAEGEELVDMKTKGILENIDMFAFTPEPRSSSAASRDFDDSCSSVDEPQNRHGTVLPSGPQQPASTNSSGSGSPKNTLQGCLIEDYIRSQGETGESAVQCGRPEPPTVGVGAPGTQSVTLCLLDPEKFSETNVRRLRQQEQRALEEVQEIYGSATTSRTPVRSTVSAQHGGSESSQSRKIMHQEGSAAAWFVDESDINVVYDHFVGWTEKKDQLKLSPPVHAPPIQLQITLRCESASLSAYAGTDFVDDAKAKLHLLTTSTVSKTNKRSSRRLRNQITM
jgi:hypothetical protein